MLCDECHKNEAMINLKLILDGEIIEKHLCTECALKDFNEMNQGEYGEYTDMNINESDIRSLFEACKSYLARSKLMSSRKRSARTAT